jgi:hypothetical protein
MGDPSRAVYGTIVVLAVIAGISTDPDVGAGYVLAVALVTSVVFWAAHVYSGVLAQRMVRADGPLLAAVGRTAREEWPLVEAVLPPAVPLVLGAVGVLEHDTAVTVAIVVGLAELFGWGIAVGRAMGLAVPLILLTGAVNVGLGGLMVVLKALLHH